MSSLIVGPSGADDAIAVGPVRRSRLFRLNDAALLVVLVVPQVVWVAAGAYLLHRHY